MFTANLFKEHIWITVRRNARKLRDLVEKVEPGKPVDVFNLMNRFTLDTIGEIGFGKCIGSLEDPSSPFLESFDKAQQKSLQRFYMPLWRWMRWMGTGIESETAVHFGRLNEYSLSVVRELCANITRDTSTKSGGLQWGDIEARKSFIGLFLEDAKKRGETLSEDFLRDLVLNFLIAGRDTTAQALSWSIYCLCTNPDAQEKARNEVRDECGVRGPTYEDMQGSRLPYLQAVISEALRLHPSVPIDAKETSNDDTLPDSTFVPAGTIVLYNIYAMGRDCSIWGDDAASFRPERWLEMDSVPDNYRYPVFNAGPRECLGRRLAMVEMKTCLAMLLPEISFELAIPAGEITPDTQLTLGMARGLPCYVQSVREAGDKTFVSNASTGTAAPSEGQTSTASEWTATPLENTIQSAVH